jgi:NSS family neurotransmitter:Na+ symporter
MSGGRELWSSRAGFVLACVGSAVGLGNVWRFPYVCHENGGGAFLIPYFVALFTTGIPLLILEFALGHKMRCGAPEAFERIRSGTSWIGWAQLAMVTLIGFYYSVVMAWSWVYLFESFDLGWGDDAKGFFFGDTLGLTKSPLEIGGLQWPVVVGLALTWLCVFLIIFKGVKAVSKVVLITVPLPAIFLLVFVVRGVTLDGAAAGVDYYLTPDFGRLLDPQVWLGAYGQIFFSTSLGAGIMIAYASYLPKDSDVNNNAFITALSNCGISFFAGFAVFSALGFMAQLEGKAVADVVASGPGLAFVTYPTLISHLGPLAPVFGILFFLMLLTLGIDSLFSLVEAVVAGGQDGFALPKAPLVAVLCALGFAGGLWFTTGGGLYWLDIVDHYITYLVFPLFGLLECLLIAWIFKASRLRAHANEVSDFRVGGWWNVCITVVTPVALAVLFVTYLYRRLTEPYEGYPQTALVLGGWLVVVGIFAGGVVAMFVHRRRRRPGAST